MANTLILKLKQQTPMIHFQYEQEGVVLRASEVKPKLDRFLIKEIIRNNPEGTDYSRYMNWFLKNENSYDEKEKKWKTTDFDKCKGLNYKMRIIASGQPELMPIRNIKPYFAGTMKSKDAILYSDEIEVEIICFNRELLDMMSEQLMRVFFLTTNFGARQNKGLGCFSLVEVNGVREQSMSDSELLKNYFGTQAVYKIVYNKQTDVVDIINEATFIYQILKSGNNNGVYIKSFITEWFWDKGLASEKRLLKQKGVSPAEYKPANEQYRPRANGTPQEGRYIRSMLGITGAISYIDKVDSSGNAVTVNKNGKDIPVKDNIKIDSISKDKIERLASPIVFSIHNNTLYIIPYEPDDVIFDADFRFQIKLDRNASFRPRANEIVISTPSKDEFSMAQLIADYVAHLNASGTNIDKYHSFACKMNKPNRYPRLMYKEQRLAVKKL